MCVCHSCGGVHVGGGNGTSSSSSSRGEPKWVSCTCSVKAQVRAGVVVYSFNGREETEKYRDLCKYCGIAFDGGGRPRRRPRSSRLSRMRRTLNGANPNCQGCCCCYCYALIELNPHFYARLTSSEREKETQTDELQRCPDESRRGK